MIMKKFTTIFFVTQIIFTMYANGQWILANNGLINSGVFSIKQNGNSIFAGTNIGICVSVNQGASWTGITSSGPVLGFAGNGDTLISATLGSGVYLSVDSGATWNPVNNGLTDTNIYSLLVDGATIFAGTGNGIFISGNNGSSWNPSGTGITVPITRCLFKNGADLLAGTEGGGAFISSNGGISWLPVSSGIPSNTTVHAFASAGSLLFSGTDSGIYKSTDNGLTWNPVNSGLPGAVVNSLAVNGSSIFAGLSNDGIFISDTGAISWNAVNTGLQIPTGIPFSLTPVGPDLFAAIYSNGIYIRHLVEMTDVAEVGKADHDFLFYPDPFSDEITIELHANSDQKWQFALYNSIGEKIAEQLLITRSTKLNLSQHASGIYFYELFNDQKLISKGKLIRQ